MPDFDFDAFNHDENVEDGVSAAAGSNGQGGPKTTSILPVSEDISADISSKISSQVSTPEPAPDNNTEEVDKW
jgi:hypothetical protein